MDEINLRDIFSSVENHSVGAYGFVKKGIDRLTNEVRCIKIIIKRKFSAEILDQKKEIMEK